MTPGQAVVLRAFAEFGDMTDVALATYVHHIADEPMSSSGIRTRRAELTRFVPALLEVVDTKVLKSGRRAAIHGLTDEGRKVALALGVESIHASVR